MRPRASSRAAVTCSTLSRWPWRTASTVWSARPREALRTGPQTATIAEVGPLNDRAYDFGTDSFTRALQRAPGRPTHIYVARDDGEPVGCLLMTDHDGNSDVEAVAVVPEARGRGISGNLLRHALVDARERGNETSTLVSTPLGHPVYEQVGFEPLERVSMWERAPA